MIKSDFYGDSTRWFVGVVVNYNDPEERGRVQVRIHGIHTDNLIDLPDYVLPWAECMLPSTEGGVSGIGKIAQIQNSAMVFGIFLDGKTSQSPLVLGSLTHNEGASETQRYMAGQRGQAGAFGIGNSGTDGAIVSPAAINIWADGDATIDQRRLLIMKFLTDNRLTANTAAGITGNLEAENSSFEPAFAPSQSQYRVSGVREGSYGIAQWNKKAGRFDKLVLFANNTDQDPEEIFTQLKFILHELRGKSNNNDGGSDFSNVYVKLQNCNTFEGGVSETNSTWQFCRWYENPADPQGKLSTREIYARKAYEQWYDYQTTSASAG